MAGVRCSQSSHPIKHQQQLQITVPLHGMDLCATKLEFWGWLSFQSPTLLLAHVSRWTEDSSAWKLRHVRESEQSFISALWTTPSLIIFAFPLLSVRHRLPYWHLSVSTNHEFDCPLHYHAGKFPDCFSQVKMSSCHQGKCKKDIVRAASGGWTEPLYC